MNREEFNAAVAGALRDRGRDDVADMSERFDADMTSMSAATVATEIGEPIAEASVPLVVEERIGWFEEHEAE